MSGHFGATRKGERTCQVFKAARHNGGVDAAARFHSSIAGSVMMRNALPPLASNDLLCFARRLRQALSFAKPFEIVGRIANQSGSHANVSIEMFLTFGHVGKYKIFVANLEVSGAITRPCKNNDLFGGLTLPVSFNLEFDAPARKLSVCNAIVNINGTTDKNDRCPFPGLIENLFG
jgi:hypothetical protein